ncbi:MAG: hypothetical protein ACK5MP_10865 [Nostocoides sp.]
MTSYANVPQQVRRRTVTSGVAWATPAVVIGAASGAYAASPTCQEAPNYAVTATCGSGGVVTYTMCAAAGETIPAGTHFAITSAGDITVLSATTTNGSVTCSASLPPTCTLVTGTTLAAGSCLTLTVTGTVANSASTTTGTIAVTEVLPDGSPCPGYPTAKVRLTRKGQNYVCAVL